MPAEPVASATQSLHGMEDRKGGGAQGGLLVFATSSSKGHRISGACLCRNDFEQNVKLQNDGQFNSAHPLLV